MGEKPFPMLTDSFSPQGRRLSFDEAAMHVTMRMNLKDVTLSQGNQSQKD